MGRNIEIAHQIDGCCRLFETWWFVVWQFFGSVFFLLLRLHARFLRGFDLKQTHKQMRVQNAFSFFFFWSNTCVTFFYTSDIRRRKIEPKKRMVDKMQNNLWEKYKNVKYLKIGSCWKWGGERKRSGKMLIC